MIDQRYIGFLLPILNHVLAEKLQHEVMAMLKWNALRDKFNGTHEDSKTNGFPKMVLFYQMPQKTIQEKFNLIHDFPTWFLL